VAGPSWGVGGEGGGGGDWVFVGKIRKGGMTLGGVWADHSIR